VTGLQLLAPGALLALLPLGAIIVLLYLLKLRRREMAVPSVFLWRRSVEDVQANAPLQRLRFSWLLLLQLLALAALVVGLAAPYVMAPLLPGRTIVIVVDASASMRATDEEGSRFERARQRARELVGAMSGRDEAALIECGVRSRVVVPLTGDRRRLRRAIDALSPGDCSTNLSDGMLLGASLAAKRDDAAIYLISDGGFREMPEAPAGMQVHFLSVGRRCDNVAILAFEVSRPAGADAGQLFLRVRNYSPTAKQCELSFYLEDAVLDARRIEVPGGSDSVQTYEVAIAEPGLMRAELVVEDDLAADNVAWTHATPPSAVSVLLVGPENLFLEQALVVQPELRVFRAPSLSAAQAPGAYEEYDIVIFDRAKVPVPPASGAVMMIASTGWPELAASGETVERPRISAWERDHPALRYVNLAAVGISEARALSPGVEAEVVASAGETPLIVALEREELRALALGWDLLDSDLPLRVGFPVLLSNATRWLGELGRRDEARVIRPGATVRLALPPDVESAELRSPDGRRERLEAVGGEIAFAGSDRVGLYTLTAGDRRWRWAADMRDEAESDLTPRTELKLGERSVAAARRKLRTERHFWPWLAVLALIALLAEWHLYHRRY